MQQASETDRARTADAAPVPRFTPVPPMPRDPAAPDHNWPDRWRLRSYLELGALDTAPGSARAHVGAVLREWGLGGIADDSCLIVSELITNAVASTRRERRPDPVRMWMLGSGAGVLFLVWDATSPAPVRRVITPDAEHGRGLNIVEALSDRWGSFHASGHPGGKVVWARAGSAPAGRPVPVLPVRRAPAPPAANGRRPRKPVPPRILARVKAALERLPAPHPRDGAS
jgi:hypothetical protein